MQELLGRLGSLDPEASQSLRVIACFDELIVGNVNTRALLAAAASLAGCNAGFRQESAAHPVRVDPRGEFCTDGVEFAQHQKETSDGLTVWLERTGTAKANDAIILERLALAIRIRHGQGRARPDTRRDLGVLLDPSSAAAERHDAAGRLGLSEPNRYRVVAAPLFATWKYHPAVAEDVVPTPFGSIHALVVPWDHPPVQASPHGRGPASRIEHLHRSFRMAVVALRLCDPPETPAVEADQYGGLIEILADSPADAPMPDADLVGEIMQHPWGRATLDALSRCGSVRQAARHTGVHHSTMHGRLEAINDILGFDPLDGLGRSRLGIAYLVWRLRHSRVLDLPAPDYGRAASGVG